MEYSNFPFQIKEQTDHSKHWVDFYHLGYINTDFRMEFCYTKGSFEIFARHNPLMVGLFTPVGWEFPTSL